QVRRADKRQAGGPVLAELTTVHPHGPGAVVDHAVQIAERAATIEGHVGRLVQAEAVAPVALAGTPRGAIRVGHAGGLFAVETTLAVREAVAADVTDAVRKIGSEPLPVGGPGRLAVDVGNVPGQGRREAAAGAAL